MVLKVTTRSEMVEENGWGLAGTRWYAELTPASGREVRGCPLGRGATRSEAVADLAERVRSENPGTWVFEE